MGLRTDSGEPRPGCGAARLARAAARCRQRGGIRRSGTNGLRGAELDDLAHQAADDAVMSILGKLDDFRVSVGSRRGPTRSSVMSCRTRSGVMCGVGTGRSTTSSRGRSSPTASASVPRRPVELCGDWREPRGSRHHDAGRAEVDRSWEGQAFDGAGHPLRRSGSRGVAEPRRPVDAQRPGDRPGRRLGCSETVCCAASSTKLGAKTLTPPWAATVARAVPAVPVVPEPAAADVAVRSAAPMVKPAPSARRTDFLPTRSLNTANASVR